MRDVRTRAGRSRTHATRRPIAVAAVVLVAALLAVALPGAWTSPARAAAPVGDETTPGIWRTSTVTFVSRGATVATVEVADGGHAPRQPAPPASDGVFEGWFVSVGGVEVPFDFDTTVVTTDLTVVARFASSHVVQFLAPPSLLPRPRVLDTLEIADGSAVGDVAPDVPRVPAGSVFTGDWYVRGDATRTVYDLDQPLTADLVLEPLLAEGFAVSFVTGGTAVEPVFVLEPDTALTQAELDAVPAPTRVGYAFTGWFADAARSRPAPTPLTSTATLYAGWSGQEVEYSVSYWLEKPGVLPASYPPPVWTDEGDPLPAWGPADGALSPAQLRDRTNFDFLTDLPSTATAGTTVSGPTDPAAIPEEVRLLVRAQLDPALVQPDPLAFADIGLSEADVSVAGDGSTVVNVYLVRALWRVDYRQRAPGLAGEANRCTPGVPYDLQMTVGGTSYYTSAVPQLGDGHRIGTFSARAKIGLDLALVGAGPVPLSQTDGTHLITSRNATTLVEDCVLRGWGPQQASSTVFQALFTGNYADAGGVDVAARTTSLSARWAALRTQHLTERFLYVETEDQATPAPDEVIGPDGTPNDPLHVATLYNNDRTTVRAEIPPGHQVFEQYLTARYWASLGDRQVAGVLEGFTSYVGYNTGPDTQGNFFQLDQPTNRLYQLRNSGNTNDDFRYQFYSRNSYDLAYVTGGGSAIPPARGVRYESALAGYAPDAPTRGDDVFLGWYTDSSATAEPFDFATATMPASNLVVYARWLLDPHTVRFYDDPAASVPIARLTEVVEDQQEADEPAPLPDRPDGSSFLGWFQRTADGYFVPYDFATPVGSDAALYARWQQPSGSPFEVRYDGDGHTAGTVPVDRWTYDASARAVVKDGAGLERDGEVLVGWRVRLEGEAARVVSPETGPVDGLFQAGHTLPVGGADVTLVAVYADPHPQVVATFDENGGAGRRTGWDAVPGAAVTYPGAADLSFTGPGAGRAFLGWSTDPAARAADPAFDRLVVDTLESDVVLYAVWSAAEPTPGPVVPTPGPTSTGPVPSPSAAPPGGPDPDELGVTGTSPWLPALLAAGALAAGLGLMHAARRRT